MWHGVSSNPMAYADDISLFYCIPDPQNRSDAATQMNVDLEQISSWCKRWGMKLVLLRPIVSFLAVAEPAIHYILLSSLAAKSSAQERH